MALGSHVFPAVLSSLQKMSLVFIACVIGRVQIAGDFKKKVIKAAILRVLIWI